MKRATVPLPEAPVIASPVPWPSSIHATPGRGNYGDADYRGNGSGLLLRDLLLFYQPSRVLAPPRATERAAMSARSPVIGVNHFRVATGILAT
jgi:hypothetical protein